MLALYLQILLIMTSLPTPFNIEVPRELSSYVGAPQTSTLKGERREIISYISWDHRVPTYYDHDCGLSKNEGQFQGVQERGAKKYSGVSKKWDGIPTGYDFWKLIYKENGFFY